MAVEEKPAAEEVQVRRSRIALPTTEGEPQATIYVTYTVKGLTPGLITIPEKEWSAEREAELIRDDIKKRRETGPTTIRL